MCLAQGPQRSDAGEARTRGPSVSSQALYHWATALPNTVSCQTFCYNLHNRYINELDQKQVYYNNSNNDNNKKVQTTISSTKTSILQQLQQQKQIYAKNWIQHKKRVPDQVGLMAD